jgi:hypothetical protein
VQEGRGDEVLLLVRSDNSEAAHQRLVMAAMQWSLRSRASRRRWPNGAREKRSGWWPPLVMSKRSNKEASPRGAAMTGGHRR